MIKQYIPISLLAATSLFGTRALAQDQFTQDFEGIRQELVSWDPVRGEWLSSSLVAMSRNQPVPDRMFPEDYTPVEMLKHVPASTRTRIGQTAQTQSTTSTDMAARENWGRVSSIVGRTNCSPVMGRTYGDPHLSSFDGASYSFQTVGEFVLAKSSSGNFEVQARQRAQSDNFSLNTAVAMNVAGDRVCIYAQEKPDGNNTTPVRLHGEAIYVEDQTYYLEHGGTIRRTKRNNYLVTWPTGETVTVDINNSSSTFPFMNLALQVYPCSDSYEGVLGNANGRSSDDFDTRGGGGRPANLAFHNFGGANDPASEQMEREYLAWLAKDFASSWRVQQPTSLFDYGFGQSTLTYTDLSFPRVHHTLGDLTPNQRDNARRECERAGVLAQDMNGCIYDQAFVNIPPSPRPTVPDRTTGILKPVEKPVPNVNPGGTVRRPSVGGTGAPDKGKGSATPPVAQPIGTNNTPITETGTNEKPITRTPATNTETAQPVEKPIEKPVSKPIEQPVEKPVKKPAPIERPVESRDEAKPARNNGGGRFLENSGSSSSGSSSSGSSSSGSSGRSSSPSISIPSPSRNNTPAPAPKPSAPAPTPVKTPTPMPTKGGR